MIMNLSRAQSTPCASGRRAVMPRNRVIYQTVCSREVSEFVRLTEIKTCRPKGILKTVLKKSGGGVMEAEGGVLIVGLRNYSRLKVKELKQEKRKHIESVDKKTLL